MNKSYRSIFNEALGTWVAVSEIDSARGKKSRSGVVAGFGGLMATAAIATLANLTFTPISAVYAQVLPEAAC